MASTVNEVRDWLKEWPGDLMIAVDEGGLTLVLYPADATVESRRKADGCAPGTPYFEIGGVDIDDDDE